MLLMIFFSENKTFVQDFITLSEPPSILELCLCLTWRKMGNIFCTPWIVCSFQIILSYLSKTLMQIRVSWVLKLRKNLDGFNRSTTAPVYEFNYGIDSFTLFVLSSHQLLNVLKAVSWEWFFFYQVCVLEWYQVLVMHHLFFTNLKIYPSKSNDCRCCSLFALRCPLTVFKETCKF